MLHNTSATSKQDRMQPTLIFLAPERAVSCAPRVVLFPHPLPSHLSKHRKHCGYVVVPTRHQHRPHVLRVRPTVPPLPHAPRTCHGLPRQTPRSTHRRPWPRSGVPRNPPPSHPQNLGQVGDLNGGGGSVGGSSKPRRRLGARGPDGRRRRELELVRDDAVVDAFKVGGRENLFWRGGGGTVAEGYAVPPIYRGVGCIAIIALQKRGRCEAMRAMSIITMFIIA